MEDLHKRLEKLAKQNKELSDEVLKHVQVVRRRLFWTQLAAWIKLTLIAVPIILLLFWLPPRMKVVWGDYETFRTEFQTSFGNGGGIIGQLVPLIGELLQAK